MLLGFTGTSNVPTPQQSELITRMVTFFRKEHVTLTLHHAANKGANEVAALALMSVGGTIVAHPGDTPGMTMEKVEGKFTSVTGARVVAFWQNQQPNLVRNRIIVDRSEFLLLCPEEHETEPRKVPGSDPWYTCRYAQVQKKPYMICLPDGAFHLSPGALSYTRPYIRSRAAGRL